ncbi:MAG: glycosyltransferase family 4 protein [Cyanobacteria bacterium J06633_2]
MNILFLHPNFPAQFRHLVAALGKDPSHTVVFGTARQDGQIPGVHKVRYAPVRQIGTKTHPYVRSLENATLVGQATYRMAQQLKAQGFYPDMIVGHSGWGPTLFMKDVFPKAQLICYFEWFYHAHGSDADFDPTAPLSLDDELAIRLKNTPILTDLYSCDRGLSPTHWQKQQFPTEFHSKISVLHDGIDSQLFKPNPGAKLILPSQGLDLSDVPEIVTYVARGMEPYRGFPQFIEAAALLQANRPHCHIVVVGEDRVAYGSRRSDGKTYKDWMIETTPLDLSRIHFTGLLPYLEYRQVLQASSVHVYLTRPFVLSWSLMEALSVGCAVVASDTAPVREVIQHEENGVLVDFFSPAEIAERVEELLDRHWFKQELSVNARQTIVENYNLAKLLPQHIQWLLGDRTHPLTVVPERVSKGFGSPSRQRPSTKTKRHSNSKLPKLPLRV